MIATSVEQSHSHSAPWTKWDDELKYEMVRHDQVNTINGMKWKWFIVPIKVEQLNANSFLDTYNSNNKKTGMNEMKMNDYEKSMR